MSLFWPPLFKIGHDSMCPGLIIKNNNTSTGCVIYSPVKVHQSTTGLKLMIHVPTMDLHDSRYN